MQPAFENDLLASALVALALQTNPPERGDIVARAAIEILNRSSRKPAARKRQMLELEAVMGFGPLGRPQGNA